MFFLELGQGQIATLDDCLMAFVPLCWGLACSPVWRFVHSAKKLLDIMYDGLHSTQYLKGDMGLRKRGH